MKATGIVRRIDDLGRVVIPKEIRRTLRIREGDPLEIFTESDGEVIFKKYSPMGELSQFSAQYCEVLSRTADIPVIITDRDVVISASGVSKKEWLEQSISEELERLMESRENFIFDSREREKLHPVRSNPAEAAAAFPIIGSGDVCGAVIFLSSGNTAPPTEAQIMLIKAAAVFLGKQMET